jgi:hypothetical protein
MYVSRPGDSSKDKAEARGFRVHEHLKEWLPPVAFRQVMRARRVWRRIF